MRTARALVAPVFAVAVCLVPLRADADAAKAWAAAKTNLPSTTNVLVGLNLTTLTKSSLFSMAFPLLLAQQPDVKSGLDLIKTTCKIDPMTVIDGLVVGMDKDQNTGAVFLALNGVDEAKIARCLEDVAKSKGQTDAKVTITKDGTISEMTDGKHKAYVSWIGKDVLVMPLKFDDKAQLQKWTGAKGGLAKAPIGKVLSKVDTRAGIWAVTANEQDLDGMKMKIGYGSLNSMKGSLVADLHIVVASAADAKSIADKAQTELAAKAADPALAANLQTMLKGVSVKSAGSEVLVKATMIEKDLLSLAGALMTR
jgi:hypothetical protein